MPTRRRRRADDLRARTKSDGHSAEPRPLTLARTLALFWLATGSLMLLVSTSPRLTLEWFAAYSGLALVGAGLLTLVVSLSAADDGERDGPEPDRREGQ
jgi:hypothetical protein